jgi:hypothetical protein
MTRALIPALCLTLLACDEKKAAPPPEPPKPPPAEKKVEPPKPPPLALEERSIEVKNLSDTLTLKVKVPVGWTGETSFRPKDDLGDRLLSFEAGCDGSCAAKDLPKNLDKLIAKAPDGAAKPNLNTGDPKLDAVRLDVKVIEKGDLADGKFVVYQVSKPAGLDGPYPEGLRARCGVYRKGDPAFVVVNAKAPAADEKTLWPLLVEACKGLSVTAPAPKDK